MKLCFNYLVKIFWFLYCTKSFTESVEFTNASDIQGNDTLSRYDDHLEINYLHIYSNIRYRYARTRVLIQLTNHAPTRNVTAFYFKIPKEEFVTEFNIERNGAEYKGKSEIADLVEQVTFHGSANRSNWIGIVELIESSQFDLYKMTINLAGYLTLNVTFVYEGLVQKISGNNILLLYELNIKPEQISRVKSYAVKVNILESRLSRPWLSNLRGKNKILEIDQKSYKVGEDNWEVSWNPSEHETKELVAQEILGQVQIMYNIFPAAKNENHVVLVRDGYLAYMDDPSLGMGRNIQNFQHEILLPRHVVFVLDVSGSMEGRRLEQLKLGMTKILNLMKSYSNYRTNLSFIDIVTFSDKIKIWSPLGVESPHPLYETFQNIAINFIKNLTANGSTNFFGGIEAGLRLAKRAKKFELDAKSILFFVTDGEATSGIIDPHLIRNRIQSINPNGTIPIYSLAFGAEADFALCRNISSDTKGGLARKIFDLDTEDTAASFESFYAQIASPSLQNVTFNYTTPIYYVDQVTHQKLVSVQLSSPSERQSQKLFTAIKFDATTFEIPCAEHCLMERIFAIRKIKKLYKLEEERSLDGYCLRAEVDRRSRSLRNIREANSLAKQHNFVTPCTSLLIKA